MPKKSGPDAKKPRKSSASKDAISSSPGVDIIPPPNPTATHLVATNPFDDPPPSNHMKMMHGFSGQPVMRMPGPPGGPMGPGFAGFGPRPGLRSSFNGPGTPGWSGPVHGNGGMHHHPPYHPTLPPNSSLPSTGYVRSHFPGAGMSSYRSSPRMQGSNLRASMAPLGSPDSESMMHESPNMGPNHMVSSGNQGHMLQNTGQMKALTRPTSNKLPQVTRKNSTSSNKNLNSDAKSPRNPESATKTRKKSEKKAAQEKLKMNEAEKLALSNGNDRGVPPHSIPPKEPQLCKRCNKNIDYPNEDAICCIASCNMWYHRKCVGLTPEAYKYLKAEELAIWACDPCLQTKEIHSVRSRTSFLEGQLASA